MASVNRERETTLSQNRTIITFILAAALGLTLTQDKIETWNRFQRRDFVVDGCPAWVTEPAIPAPGHPWIWRTSFPDFHTEVDLQLLRHGWSVGYVECLDMLGSDGALDIMDAFYNEVTKDRGLSPRPAMEGVSRGGLHVYRYAARHPERVACIYCDTPVMNLASWPLGAGAAKETADALHYYGFKDEAALRAYRGNPIDLLGPIAKAKIPIRHVVSLSDTLVPPAQNTFEAKRRLEKLGWDMDVVTVKEGTAESHGHHFDLPEVFQSARFIMDHSAVLPNGYEYFTLRDGLGACAVKFVKAKAGRVAFLGGSITNMHGWREDVMEYLEQRFPATKFDFIMAGVPSLGSVPHAFRLEKDVLSKGPIDLLFIEAAVNDHNYDGQPNTAILALRGMEGVVRHVRMTSPQTDIVEMHFIHDEDLKTWGEGKVPYPVAAHERVAERYGFTSLNLSREVYDRIADKEFTWAGDFKDLHPSPYGHQLYANSMMRMLDAAFATPPRAHRLPRVIDPLSYFRGRFGEIASAHELKDFVQLQSWKPNDGKETREGYVNVPALVGEVEGASFEFDFEGTAVGLMITSGPDAGTIAFSIDGGPERTVDTRTAWSHSLYLPWALMLQDDLPHGKHTIRVRLVNGALRVFHFLEN